MGPESRSRQSDSQTHKNPASETLPDCLPGGSDCLPGGSDCLPVCCTLSWAQHYKLLRQLNEGTFGLRSPADVWRPDVISFNALMSCLATHARVS